jgi:ATP-dependent exoDNAse (exonuclease V) alpha subunit
MVHEHIRDGRDDIFEEKNTGRKLSEIELKNLPPCSRDPGAFSPIGFKIIHYDPLDWRNLPEVEEDIPPYSFCTSPYGRMFKESGEGWEDNPKRQLERLNEFWKPIEPGKSLVFFYVNHGNPLKEEKSDRILVGIGRISKIGNQLFFGKKKGYMEDYPIWSRCIIHNFPEEGIRLPYQEYINNGYDLSNIVCTIPISARPYFSYVAEHVPDDIAVGIIERVIQSVKTIIAENKVPEPYGKTWEYRLKWLNSVLEEVWKNRGRFPGIGSVLEYLGFKNGIIYHRTVLSPREANGENIYDFVVSILEGKKSAPEEYQNEFRKSCAKWQTIPPEKRELLKVLSHFELSPEQIKRICDPTKRREAFIEASEREIIENPYIISELDDGDKDSPPVDFETIDRGMIPSEEVGKIKGEIESISNDDKRRVRALLVEILKEASQEGDTCLSIDEAIKRVRKRLPENRICEPDRDIIINNRSFFEERISFFPEENPKVIALKSLHRMELEVKKRLEVMVEKKYENAGESFWEKLLCDEFKDIEILNEEIEKRARKEKIKALDTLFRFRFSVLTGRAGTGKTTVLKVFIRGLREKEGKQSILLLAPTGKARVRLQEKTRENAQTIHQFLMRLGWIRGETFSLKEKEGNSEGAQTVIIDEASMIPMDLLGVLFRAIDFNYVKRLVLVGDPNQLPPIGPGRPFVDIIKWLESDGNRKEHIAKLTQRVRHENLESQCLKLADSFLMDRTSPGDDEILSQVAQGKVSGDLEVHFWDNEEELYEMLLKAIRDNIKLNEGSTPDFDGFNKSIEKPDKWQILSPTRMQIFGTTEINRVIQKIYRRGLIERAKRKKPKPFGEQQMVWNDKVIQVVNSKRDGWKDNYKVDGYVANGEVGLIVNTSKKYDSIDVKFPTQPNLTYRYYRSEIDENLELAYAITVHKSQGSDFDIVFFILPQSAGTMSRELLYTALTRFKKKTIVLIEKDVSPLIIFRNPQYSEILRRNTNLFELSVRPETVGIPHPERLIHRTKTGVLVRSKSEVIIANILTDLGISYEYEKPLYSKTNPQDFRLPDFTIKYEGEEFYWEHLGMLEDPEYKKEWESKEKWYKENDYFEKLIISKDGPDGRIDSQEIERLAKEKIIGDSHG